MPVKKNVKVVNETVANNEVKKAVTKKVKVDTEQNDLVDETVANNEVNTEVKKKAVTKKVKVDTEQNDQEVKPTKVTKKTTKKEMEDGEKPVKKPRAKKETTVVNTEAIESTENIEKTAKPKKAAAKSKTKTEENDEKLSIKNNSDNEVAESESCVNSEIEVILEQKKKEWANITAQIHAINAQREALEIEQKKLIKDLTDLMMRLQNEYQEDDIIESKSKSSSSKVVPTQNVEKVKTTGSDQVKVSNTKMKKEIISLNADSDSSSESENSNDEESESEDEKPKLFASKQTVQNKKSKMLNLAKPQSDSESDESD
jgi:hypothetical protein